MKSKSNLCNKYESWPSASDLILDILSGYGPQGLDVQSLCRAGMVMGISETNIRVKLNRLTKERKICSPQRGYYAIDFDGYVLHADVGTWWTREQTMVAWDGSWVAVHNLGLGPGTAKQRKGLRALELRGFASFRKGLLLRPNNLSGGVIALRDRLQALGLGTDALVAELTELGARDEASARSLWIDDDYPALYEEQLGRIQASSSHLAEISLEEAARESLFIGRNVIRFIMHDPLLPEELLSGDKRRLLIKQTREYQIRARQLWADFISEGQVERSVAAKPPVVQDIFLFQNI